MKVNYERENNNIPGGYIVGKAVDNHCYWSGNKLFTVIEICPMLVRHIPGYGYGLTDVYTVKPGNSPVRICKEVIGMLNL